MLSLALPSGAARARPARRAPAAVLFVGGTINHTTQVMQIAAELREFEHAYTWYYGDGILEVFRRLHILESTALGKKLRARCLARAAEDGSRERLTRAEGLM